LSEFKMLGWLILMSGPAEPSSARLRRARRARV
jgi:hypothetical protein